MGTSGLLVFALLVSKLAPRHRTSIVLMGATVAWRTVSMLTWHVRKRV
jgi:hypothetical protein